jgi:hypothetical protein
MIRPLRQRHRRIFTVLAVVLPAAFVIGVAARRPVPAVSSFPKGIASASHDYSVKQWSRDNLFPKAHVQVVFLRDGSERSRFAVAITAPKDFVKPDLLVYWVPGEGHSPNTVPDNAILLGSFSNSVPLPLPDAVLTSKGVLLLYSLADNEIVEFSQPIDFSAP